MSMEEFKLAVLSLGDFSDAEIEKLFLILKLRAKIT